MKYNLTLFFLKELDIIPILIIWKGILAIMEDFKELIKENRQYLALFCITSVALLVILAGSMTWKLPVIGVSVFVLLETILAVCLQDLPVWLHGAVLIAQLIIGLLFGNGMFILLCALYYVVSIVVLRIWDR